MQALGRVIAETIPLTERAIRLSPRDPSLGCGIYRSGGCYEATYFAGLRKAGMPEE
jgi:hypothetical protein